MADEHPKCGKLDFGVEVTDEWEGGRDYLIEVQLAGRFAGKMDLATVDIDGQPALAIEYAKVETPRCGIGTKLYEQALRLACRDGVPLASDWSRTEASEQLWQKQARKGRAVCYLADEPGRKLQMTPGGFDKVGTWPCRRYVMREACPRKIDLSGRKRR
jgi:hypothetical protein